MPLAIDFLTDDERLVALARAYWAQDDEGRFPAKVAELATRHGLRPSDVAKTVAGAAVVRSTTATCSRCGLGRPFMSRADYSQRRSWNGWQREWTPATAARRS